MDHIGIATDGAVFDIFLLRSAGAVQRDHDLLTAGRTNI
jgi:hypothetical protein